MSKAGGGTEAEYANCLAIPRDSCSEVMGGGSPRQRDSQECGPGTMTALSLTTDISLYEKQRSKGSEVKTFAGGSQLEAARMAFPSCLVLSGPALL